MCLTCGTVSCATEPCLDLSLPIPASRKGAVVGVAATAGGAAAGGAAAGGGAMRGRVLAKLSPQLTAPHAQLRLSACLQARPSNPRRRPCAASLTLCALAPASPLPLASHPSPWPPQSFCAPETLEGENAYACDKCAAAAAAGAAAAGREPPPAAGQPALKWLQLARTPRALTLHLKRFRWVGRKVHKVSAFVPFPARLDLSPFACADAPVEHFTEWRDYAPSDAAAATAAEGQQLQLYGVVEHHGPSFESGHYLAYVRLGDEWFQMNDSVVTRVDEAAVMHAQAFILFYH